jgi:acyl-CoA thioesterase
MSKERYEAAAKDKQYFSKYLGIDFAEFREGYTKATIEVSDNLLNRLGLVHGGVTYSLMDTCMGGAVFSLLNDDQYCVAMEVKTNYLRPAMDGQLVAEARVAHSGHKVAVATCEVHDGTGDLIAMATGSFYISNEGK